MSEYDPFAELVTAWVAMDVSARLDLVDHARWLAAANRLVGGPLDGLRIPDRFKNESSVSIEVDDKAAVYERDECVMFRFCEYARIGGEGGTWPDIDANELSELKGCAK
jgi:hypothetical protein